ncbi:hypothetical protein [Nibribacter koreensis]
MRLLLVPFVFFVSSFSLLGQTRDTNQKEVIALDEQNSQWLAALKGLEQGEQWVMIKERLLQNRGSSSAKIITPLLIIDGVVIPIDSSTFTYTQLASTLTEDKIKQITVVDKELSNTLFHRPFTSWIIINLKDRKTSKEFHKRYKAL